MKAHELKPGDRFTVNPPDMDHPSRVCLTNDEIYGLRWGWPKDGLTWDNSQSQRRYWAWIGGMCEVELVEES